MNWVLKDNAEAWAGADAGVDAGAASDAVKADAVADTYALSLCCCLLLVQPVCYLEFAGVLILL